MWLAPDSQNQNVLLGPRDTSRWDPAVLPRTIQNPALAAAHPVPADT